MYIFFEVLVMKSKTNFFKIILPACVVVCILSCALILGSVLATDNSGTQSDKLNLVVGVPSNAVAPDSTFTATVYVTNNNVDTFKIAGLQVDLKYDSSKVSVDSYAATALRETSSYAIKDDSSNNKVKFACVKNTYTEDEGYTGEQLATVFTVTFKAKTAINNPSALFKTEDITYMFGDTKAAEIKNANKIYGADKIKIAEALVNSEFSFTTTENAGTVVIVPLNSTKGEFDITTKSDNGLIGTGSTIKVDNEEASIVVKGDLDGDGEITVFDAMIAKKIESQVEGYTDTPLYDVAADLNSDGELNDSSTILEEAK